jgi:hypothetical protein
MEVVMSLQRKMATHGLSESVFHGGVMVCQLGQEPVPLTLIPSLFVSEHFRTSCPHHGSWIRRIEASVVCSMVISAVCCWFMLAERIMRLSSIR